MSNMPYINPAPLAPLPEEVDNRSIYLGGIDPTTTSEEILSQVTCGLIDSIKILHEKGCAFISFVDPASARIFFREANMGRFVIRDREIKVGWGKPKPLPQEVLHAIEGGATRNVFVGGLDETMTEAFFRKEFERFGEVEHLKVIYDKKVAFIHFSSLNSALKCVSTIQKEPAFSRCKVNYGKDRCNRRMPYAPMDMMVPPPAMVGHMHPAAGVHHAGPMPGMNGPHPHAHHHHHNAENINSHAGLNGFGPGSLALPAQVPRVPSPHSNGHAYPYAADRGHYALPMPNMAGYPPADPLASRGAFAGPVPRTVYIGGIDATTTAAELCEYIKGGMLDNIKVMPEKNCAFVTFVYPEGAQLFFEFASQGFLLKGRQVKVGWGKPSNIPQEILNAAQRGASRNVYLGSLDDSVTSQRLYDDLSFYGVIESIFFLEDKRCAFVSFTSLLSALKAVEGMAVSPKYQHLRVNYAKDNCAKVPPRATNGGVYPPTGSGSPSPRTPSPRSYQSPLQYPPAYSPLTGSLPTDTKVRADLFPVLEQFPTSYGGVY